jgi:hypothetical protein
LEDVRRARVQEYEETLQSWTPCSGQRVAVYTVFR